MKNTILLDNWVEAVKDNKIPILPGSIKKINELLKNDRFSMRDLGHLLLCDVGLALSVIRMANALPHKHFRSEIATCDDAVMMLGSENIRRHAYKLSQADDVLQEPVHTWFLRLSAQSTYAALLSKTWGEVRHDMVPNELALAALLYPLGELILTTFDQRCTSSYLDLAQNAQVLPHEAEYIALGFNLEHLGFRLAEHWRLPTMVRECMRARNAKHMRAFGVMLAFRVAREAMHGWVHPLLAADIRLAMEYLDIDLEGLIEVINKTSEEFNNWRALYKQPPVPAMDCDQIQYLLTEGFGQPKPVFCLAPRTDLFDEFSADLAGGSLKTRDEVIETLIQALHHSLALNRVVYAKLSKEGDALVAQRLEGTEHEPSFNRFHWPLEGDYLMNVLGQRPSPFWLNASNREGIWPRIPESVRTLIGVRSFFMHSVFVRGSLDGVVYADRRYQHCALDKQTGARFRKLVELAMQRLEKLSE